MWRRSLCKEALSFSQQDWIDNQQDLTQEDYVFVYVAFATAGDAEGLRDMMKKMNSKQLAEAQRRITEWLHAIHAPSLCSPTMGKNVVASQSQ